jgi:hypothetical protein
MNYMLNRYFSEIVVDKPGDIEKANHMLERAYKSNELQRRIEEGNMLIKRICWIPLAEISVPDFPVLSKKDLRRLTARGYQIKLAPSYMARVLPSDIEEEIEPSLISFHWDEPTLVCFRIASRHKSQKVHQTFVQYVPTTKAPAGIRQEDQIIWYCKCSNRQAS